MCGTTANIKKALIACFFTGAVAFTSLLLAISSNYIAVAPNQFMSALTRLVCVCTGTQAYNTVVSGIFESFGARASITRGAERYFNLLSVIPAGFLLLSSMYRLAMSNVVPRTLAAYARLLGPLGSHDALLPSVAMAASLYFVWMGTVMKDARHSTHALWYVLVYVAAATVGT